MTARCSVLRLCRVLVGHSTGWWREARVRRVVPLLTTVASRRCDWRSGSVWGRIVNIFVRIMSCIFRSACHKIRE